MTELPHIHHVVALGTSCFSAEFLRLTGLRVCAYPFDWVYSHPRMITDCVRDSFRNWFDKTLYVGHPHEKFCRHRIYDTTDPIFVHYHPPTFFHHNPINDHDYQYFTRGVHRFNQMLSQPTPKLFLMTYINRSAPLDADTIQSLITLKHILDQNTAHAYLLVINCMSSGPYYHQDSRVYEEHHLQPHLIIINLVVSEIVGTLFTNPQDWHFFRYQLNRLFTWSVDPLPSNIDHQTDPWPLHIV